MSKWVIEAMKYLGQKEITGPRHNPFILQLWKDIKRGGIKDDETPWCAAFAGAMLERVGIRSTRFESAKSYETWGVALAKPVYGCVVVFSRDGGGHVGFVVGETPDGLLLVLGGNQDNEVNIRRFKRERATAFRYPEGFPVPTSPLPVVASVSTFSKSEA